MHATQTRLAVIDGLRGVAILGIVFHHLVGPTTSPGWHAVAVSGFPIPLASPLANSWLAVNLFFTLSGFVIFLPFAQGKRSMTGLSSILGFWKARARRLLPLFYVASFVSVFIGGSLSDPSLWHELLLLISGLFVFTKEYWMPPQNIVLWSLGAEIWMSVVFPLVALCCRAFGTYRSASVIFFLSLLIRFIATWCLPGEFQVNPYLDRLADSFAGRLDDFVLGMCIASAWATQSLAKLPVRGAPLFCLGVLAFLIASCLWDYVILGWIPHSYTCFFNLVVGASSFCLISGILTAPSGLLLRVLTNPALCLLGAACYSIYMWHFLVERAVLPWIPGRPLALSDVGAVATYLVALTIISFVSYRLIERNPLFTKSFVDKP